MNISLIFRRSRREWRQLGVLLIGLCLVTSFFALGPLYARSMIQTGLQYELAQVTNTVTELTFTGSAPFKPESYDLVNQQLRDLNAGLVRIARSSALFGGFQFSPGDPITDFSGRAQPKRVYAFSNMKEVLKLVAGRWPERLPPPDSTERQAKDAQEQADKELAEFSRGDVEAVITTAVAQQSKPPMEIGTRFVVGERAANHVVVHIVGIVEPVNPDDPFWEGQREAIEGEIQENPVSLAQTFFPSFIILEGAYSDWMAKATTPFRGGENNTYVWKLKLDAHAVNADNIEDVQYRLSALINRMNNDYPGLFSTAPLLQLLNNYLDYIARTEGPVIFLSGAVLLLMLYHLLTTVSLVLEQQLGEWASFSSRGASTFQLVLMQALTMGLLGAVGFGVGPFLAVAILKILTSVGPLAPATGGLVALAGIPNRAFQLSAIAAAAAVVVLTLPAFPAARRSLAQFKQIVARPPTRPIWARYWLDVILIVVGLGFLARLLFFIGGDLGQTLALLFNDPRELIRELIDNANKAGGLNDPLNLTGPALFLTGIALLWLRLFPALMRLIGRFTARSNGLTGPLSVWNVERDPGHYAQLVLLLIGTLALGTAALSLGATRDQGAWTAAEYSTGGAARVDLNASTARPDQIDWTKLPGVAGSTTLTRAVTAPPTGISEIYLVGVDPTDMTKTFPELKDTLAPLTADSAKIDPAAGMGIVLPANTRRLQISAQASDDRRSKAPDELTIWLTLRDSLARANVVALTGTLATNAWAEFSGEVPPVPDGRGPWILTDMRFAPFIATEPQIQGAIAFDALQAVDAEGKTTMLNDFEDEAEMWSPVSNPVFAGQPFGPTLDHSRPAASGRSSFVVIYHSERIAPDPVNGGGDRNLQEPGGQSFQTVVVSAAKVTPSIFPVVMSERMARDEGRATRDDHRPLQVGMTGKIDIPLPGGTAILNYKIVGITPSFPSVFDTLHYLIMDARAVAWVVNTAAQIDAQVAPNQVWLEIPARQPDPNLRTAVRALPGVTSFTPAWDRFNQLLREPLPAAIAGMLYAGFWVSLLLSLLDFGFYLAVTARQRSLGFVVLRSLGWNANNIWSLLVAEQAALVVPAILVGVALGAALAYVILPFLALIGGETLKLPVGDMLVLLAVLIVGFGALLVGAAWWLRQLNVNRVLRLGEE